MFQVTPDAGNRQKREVIKGIPVGANVNIESGKFYVHVGGYLVVPAAGNAATGFRPVKALFSIDNTGGADGAVTVDGEFGLQYDFANDGTHPVTAAYRGKLSYLSSATTLSYDSTDGPVFGTIIQFNMPNNQYGRPVRAELK